MSKSYRRKDGSKWGERTIRGGTIRWFGRTMRIQTRPEPDVNGFQEPPYEGQLDGLVGLFYQYRPYPRVGGPNLDVYLHSFPADRVLEENSDDYSPRNTVDGRFVWDHFVEAKP